MRVNLMRLFLDESGTSDAVSALVLLEVPTFAVEYLNLVLTPKKKVPEFLKPVFESTSGEFKFSAFMNEYRKTKDERLVEYLEGKIKQLCAFDLSIYYSVFESRPPDVTVSESRYLLERFFVNRYFEISRDGVEIYADKQFYPRNMCCEMFRAHESMVARIKPLRESRKTGVGYFSFPIRICNSSDVKGLQAADLFAGALFQYYKRGNAKFLDLFRSKVRDARENIGSKTDGEAFKFFHKPENVAYGKRKK